MTKLKSFKPGNIWIMNMPDGELIDIYLCISKNKFYSLIDNGRLDVTNSSVATIAIYDVIIA